MPNQRRRLLIGDQTHPLDYTVWSIQTFPSFRVLKKFIEKVQETMPNPVAERANENFKVFIDRILARPNGPKIQYYGMYGKQPRSYDEAMQRDKFVYYDEYKSLKQRLEKTIQKELQKQSTAEVLKPKFVYNDKQLGEFTFDKAAMSLIPKTYYYSFVQDREIDIINEPIIREGNIMVLKADGTIVDLAIKVKTPDGEIKFIKVDSANPAESLDEARKLGVVDCTSTNKKVYLYKEKIPKTFNAIKIIVGLTATGGFTKWKGSTGEIGNDFYTGLTAMVIADVLEGLGYSVQIELVLGGGRCGACYRKLNNFRGQVNSGRRFLGFTVKPFDGLMDMDSLLYTMCDPSFHNIKFVSLLNYFFTFYGDEIDTNDHYMGNDRRNENFGNPQWTWHGIEPSDMTFPIGQYYKSMDIKKGNTSVLHFYINRVGSEVDAVLEIRDIILTAEDLNREAAEKYKQYDFSERVQ